MPRKGYRFAFFSAWLCAVVAAGGEGALGEPLQTAVGLAPGERAETIVVGAVSQDPKKRLPKLEALANYLAERLHDVGIRRGAAIVAKDNAEMVRLLRQGAVDLTSETAFSAVHFAEEGGAEFLLREWKKGIAEYRSIFIARRDSGIRSLEDLRGRRMAFEDPGSTSGFLLPLALLKMQGIETVQTPITDRTGSDRVHYDFAIEEINVAAWVARGTADAGALSNQDWEDIGRMPGPIKDDLFIFHESAPIIRSVVVVRSGLGAQRKARIKQVLLAMGDDPQARDVLEVYNKVAKFDELTGAGARSLDLARGLYPLVAAEIR